EVGGGEQCTQQAARRGFSLPPCSRHRSSTLLLAVLLGVVVGGSACAVQQQRVERGEVAAWHRAVGATKPRGTCASHAFMSPHHSLTRGALTSHCQRRRPRRNPLPYHALRAPLTASALHSLPFAHRVCRRIPRYRGTTPSTLRRCPRCLFALRSSTPPRVCRAGELRVASPIDCASSAAFHAAASLAAASGKSAALIRPARSAAAMLATRGDSHVESIDEGGVRTCSHASPTLHNRRVAEDALRRFGMRAAAAGSLVRHPARGAAARSTQRTALVAGGRRARLEGRMRGGDCGGWGEPIGGSGLGSADARNERRGLDVGEGRGATGASVRSEVGGDREGAGYSLHKGQCLPPAAAAAAPGAQQASNRAATAPWAPLRPAGPAPKPTALAAAESAAEAGARAEAAVRADAQAVWARAGEQVGGEVQRLMAPLTRLLLALQGTGRTAGVGGGGTAGVGGGGLRVWEVGGLRVWEVGGLRVWEVGTRRSGGRVAAPERQEVTAGGGAQRKGVGVRTQGRAVRQVGASEGGGGWSEWRRCECGPVHGGVPWEGRGRSRGGGGGEDRCVAGAGDGERCSGEYGEWRMVSGASMVSGAWWVEHGEWSMGVEHGEWSMVSGAW
ncbi:unnamed protein product, partial [Closterium sp. NIES-64]